MKAEEVDARFDGIIYILLVYNLGSHTLQSHESFEDVGEAMDAYARTEIEYLGRGYEVVLVGAESLEAVMITHGSYFGTSTSAPARSGLSFSLS